MAKGNLILGTGHGSIGDVTMMRRNGAEVARVRLRKIKNPKSQGQAEQRMYMAPILKFYSPLAKVLETSFEGMNKADSYAKFISVNANLARANGWAVNKGAGFIPLPYQIAGGTLPQAEYGEGDNMIYLHVDGLQQSASTLGALSTALVANYGLQNGDQVTFIVAQSNGETIIPSAFRFFIDTTSTDTLESMNLSVTIANGLYYEGQNDVIAIAVIFSRWENNAWRRSNTFVKVKETFIQLHKGTENLAAAIASYMKGAGQVPVSDVYLNGSDE